MSWNCLSCGLNGNDESEIRCACGYELVISDALRSSMRRPTSVTVIASIMLLLSAINLFTILSGNWERLAHNYFTASNSSALIGVVGLAVCAIFMLRGANWARWLYLGWIVIGTLVLLFDAKSILGFAPGAIKTVVFAYFLTRKDAAAFFNPQKVTGERSEPVP